jgi:KUP system potassium uptake protein
MTQEPDATPPALLQNVRHNRCVHEHVVFLTVFTDPTPYVRCEHQAHIEQLGPGYHRIFIRHGFMEAPDIPAILAECQNDRIVVPAQHATFFFSRLTFLATSKPGMALWRERLFVFLARNSTRASSYFRIPSDQVIEIGWIIEI